MIPDTDELLRRCADGDPSATAKLLDRHRDRLRRLVAIRVDTRIKARIDPSDVVQETLATAHRQLPEYLSKRPLPFYPWLRRIACDRLADLHRRHLRAQMRSVKREEPLGLSDDSAIALAQRLLAPESSHLGRMIRRELLERMHAALEILNPTDREMLILRHLEELDTRETAAVLGINESAAKLRHLRAVERIQKLLRQI
jgi:RNA polymerase sigma-70 factor, ECF subfamily